jgi:hypothetical protein
VNTVYFELIVIRNRLLTMQTNKNKQKQMDTSIFHPRYVGRRYWAAMFAIRQRLTEMTQA